MIDYVYQTPCEFGYFPRLYSPARQRPHENILYAVVLDIKESVRKWKKEIGFKNSKHNTKVKIWKKFGYFPPYTKIKI
jgi:hypothetical protein